MRGKSHRQLGAVLAANYLEGAPALHRRAFLLGCIQPDRNPTTYLKGSLRCQLLHGHHYDNAEPFLMRISARLERRSKLHLLDYYTAGKLIHYTADAFTYPHNSTFSGDLGQHRQYEIRLQKIFLRFLENPETVPTVGTSVIDTIRSCHREYLSAAGSALRDARYAFSVSCRIMELLTRK